MTSQTDFTRILYKKRLPSVRKHTRIMEVVESQDDFDQLFGLLFYHERPLVQRTATAVDKITRQQPEYLEPHRDQLLNILKSGDHKELKAHVIKLIPRIELPEDELEIVWHRLIHMAMNIHEIKGIRLNALQSLFELSRKHDSLHVDLANVFTALSHDPEAWMRARVSKLQ
jgi:hypothetical protein